MVGYVLSQLKPSELYILSCGKGRGLQTSAFATAKNLELLGLYPIHKNTAFAVLSGSDAKPRQLRKTQRITFVIPVVRSQRALVLTRDHYVYCSMTVDLTVSYVARFTPVSSV